MKAKLSSSPPIIKSSPFADNLLARRERSKPHLRSTGKGRKRISEIEARRVPVVIRGSVSGLPMATPRGTTKTHRRLDIPLAVPGAEIRLPSLPQFRGGWRLLSALLSLALLALLYLIWTAPLFVVNNVSIQGLQRISAREVSIELDVEDQPIFLIDPQSLREKIITQFPEFRNVEVYLHFPNKVTIQVDERNPLFVWKQGDRKLLVDAEGFAFPVRGEGGNLPKLMIEAQDFPLANNPEVQAEFREPLLPVDLVSGILSISALIPDGAVLFYDNGRGLGWRDPRGWLVYVGEPKDLGLKMKIYELMLKKIKKEEKKPVLISIEYVHAPYYRLEQ
ncbi:MAG: FtsQ-type POTRA domain-containing protein [Anaerolineales bacterium]|nr:FtsQ-type POTRA domain-containing protein [Anaerolineales bacterium]